MEFVVPHGSSVITIVNNDEDIAEFNENFRIHEKWIGTLRQQLLWMVTKYHCLPWL